MLYICLTFKFEKGKYWKLKKKGVCDHDYELLLWSMYNALVYNFWIVYIRFPFSFAMIHQCLENMTVIWEKKNLFRKKKLTKKFLSQKLIEVNNIWFSESDPFSKKKKKKKSSNNNKNIFIIRKLNIIINRIDARRTVGVPEGFSRGRFAVC